ncbi:bifunctional 3'-5' exonuclease/DNA polymerase [Sulfurihydrogenibium azorense]|uniref:bifunctional 3'-5' exonuclease/DNA polymerase n=1 Tax=Sulfurihydrogenibium azorense TaxID=309806 RepID=UPI00240943F2|nr:bifunctional 3'-5' exonuclease/DNA polymerase [Sulfurihydrogenibium azorense]MDM7274131.1 bifunctional 3'-5' exonuclease/DNA polymerase [Sulfurihydrogenibium azorense]
MVNYITQSKELTALKEKLKDLPYVYLDTEVAVKDFEKVDYFNDKVRLIQIGTQEDIFVIDAFKVERDTLKEFLKEVLESKGIVGHNLKFDLKFLATNFDVYPKVVFDTFIASKILAKGDNSQKHSLSAVAVRLTDEEVDKTYQTSPWWVENLTKEQIEYSAKDIEVLRSIFREQVVRLNEEQTHLKSSGETYKVFGVVNPVAALEMAFLPCLVSIELSGIPIDEKQLSNLIKNSKTTFQNLYIEFKRKYYIDPFSPQQVANFLTKKLGLKLPKTEKGSFSSQDVHLKPYEDKPEVKTLLSIRYEKKTLDKLEELSKYVKNSRVYGEFKQIGASTGRMSSYKPNLQNIPKNLKSIFRAPDGYLFIIADYSQIELRIAAEYTKDKSMIKAFQEKKDLHKLTASVITGKDYQDITKEERNLAKAINFGLIYGISPKSLVEYAKNNYDIDITLSQAKTFHENFFNFYPKFKEWHEKVKNYLEKHKFIQVETLLGRKLIAYKFTDAVNYPIQGSGSDLLKMAVVLFYKSLKDIDAKVVNLVHDEIVVEVKEEDVDKVQEILSQSMEKAGKYLLKEVPVEFEINVSKSWSKE